MKKLLFVTAVSLLMSPTLYAQLLWRSDNGGAQTISPSVPSTFISVPGAFDPKAKVGIGVSTANDRLEIQGTITQTHVGFYDPIIRFSIPGDGHSINTNNQAIAQIGLVGNQIKDNQITYKGYLSALPYLSLGDLVIAGGNQLLAPGTYSPKPTPIQTIHHDQTTNQDQATGAIPQNLIITNRNPSGRLVLATSQPSIDRDIERIVIEPRGAIGINMNPEGTSDLPKADIQFGDKTSMYFWGNHVALAYNSYWHGGDQSTTAGAYRYDRRKGGGAIGIEHDGTIFISTHDKDNSFDPNSLYYQQMAEPERSKAIEADAVKPITSIGYNASKTMKFDKWGNLSIGADWNPNNQYRLVVNGNQAVNGTIKAKEVRVSMSGWPDYVFHNDYKLAPLSEVEQFIKENKHLPGIEPASEVENEGLQLGEMQAKLLRKVEELTLYMIELKKENEALKAAIKVKE